MAVTVPQVLVAVNVAAAGRCTDADSIVVVAGVTLTPSSLAVSWYGLSSERRRTPCLHLELPDAGDRLLVGAGAGSHSAGSEWWV